MIGEPYFILDGHEVKRVGHDEYREWMVRNKYARRRGSADGYTTPDEDPTRVGFTRIGDTVVSTVFLGLDHGWDFTRVPILFETMVFGSGVLDGERGRYETWDQAQAGHAKWVELVRAALGTREST